MANGIMTGMAWGGTITYAFPTSASDYSYTTESDYGFAAVNSAVQATALFALETENGNLYDDGFSVEGFTLANFEAGAASSSTLRIAQSSVPGTAYAYLPTTAAPGGDVWMGTTYDYTAPQAGNYAYHTVLHELGHALGLKHSHEKFGSFGLMAAANDAVEYTVMSYKAYVGAKPTGYTYSTWSAPQTYMMADIAALQQMYGADYSTNSGDTTYKWNPNSGDTLVNGEVAIDAGGNVIFATIWDGGGNDTYDLSDYTTDLKIDLNAGKSSSFGTAQLAILGNKKTATGSIYNALLYNKNTESLIENATGGSGNDIINGNEKNNNLLGGEGNDKLYGFVGNDILGGGGGSNLLDGGVGNDYLYVVGTLTSFNTLLGGAGDDELYNHGVGTTVITDLLGNNIVVSGSMFGEGGDDKITTGAGNDFIYDYAGSNVISSGAGNDTVYGGEGTDKINGGAGNNYLYGGGGNDTIVGGAGLDTILGGDGNDTITGGAGINYLSGDAGNDTITGGAAVDTIYAGGDSDYVKAGAGNDTVYGEGGDDTLYADAGNDSVYGGDDNDKIFGVAGNNFLSGDAGNDTITGGTGIDTISGGEGADFILGGAGNDIITGDDGADSIRGGVGNDTMTGGGDADIFLFETLKTMGKDVVTDFDYAVDSLHFDLATMVTSFDSLAKQVGADLVVTFAATAVLTLQNFDIAHIDDIVFV
jgi:serralysin